MGAKGCMSGSGLGAQKSEPEVADAAAIFGEVLEGVEAVECVDGEVGDGVGWGEADVDGDAAAVGGVGVQAAPGEDIGARGAEEDFEAGIGVIAADIAVGGADDVDAFVFVIVGPEHAVAAAEGAVADGDGAGVAGEGPVCLTAMAGAGEGLGHDRDFS